MNAENNVTADEVEEEELLAELKNVRLEGIGKGKLILTDKRIEFEHRGGFLFPPKVELSIELTDIATARLNDTSHTLLLDWAEGNGEQTISKLILPETDTASHLHRSLNKKLKSLRQAAELQERRACYQAFLWGTGYLVWMLAEYLAQMMTQLTEEDWDSVDISLANIEEASRTLLTECSLDIYNPVSALSDAICSRESMLAFRCVMDTYQSIGTALSDDLTLDKGWEDVASEDSPGLRWCDIRYIFLFAGRYKLLSWWLQLGEDRKFEDSLPRLLDLLSILAYRVSRQSRLGGFTADVDSSKAMDSIDSAAKNLETLLKVNAGIV